MSSRPEFSLNRDSAAWVPWILLVLVLFLAVSLRLEYAVGSLGSDDLVSFRRAYLYTQGVWDPVDEEIGNVVTQLRFGLNLATALVFALFGPSELTGFLYPLLMSMIGIIAAFDIVRRVSGSAYAGLLSALLVSFSGFEIHSATVLLPDGPMNALGLTSIWVAIATYQSSGGFGKRAFGYFCAGLLAGLSFLTKEGGIVFIAALGIWSLVPIFRRQFRSETLFGIAGFLLPVLTEQSLLYSATGDPIFKWGTLSYALERVQENRAGEERNILIWMQSFLSRMATHCPFSVFVMASGLVLTPYLLWQYKKTYEFLLLAILAFFFLLIRLPEFTQTFSYQPRRFILGIELGAIFLGLAVASPLAQATMQRLVTSRRRSVRIMGALTGGAALIGGLALLGASIARDLDYLQAERSRLDGERYLVAWLEERLESGDDGPFYLDNRTARIVYSMLGFPDLQGRISTYPYYRVVSDDGLIEPVAPMFHSNHGGLNIYKAEHNEYLQTLEGGYFLINTRYVDWLINPMRLPEMGDYLSTLPRAWPVGALAAGMWGASHYVSVIEIRQGSSLGVVPSSQQFAQSVESLRISGAAATIETGDNVLLIDKGDETTRTFIGTNWDALPSTDGGQGRFVAEFDFDILPIPDAADENERLIRLVIEGQTVDGSTVTVGAATFGSRPWPMRTIAIDRNDLTNIRLRADITGPGRFELGQVRLRPVLETQDGS